MNETQTSHGEQAPIAVPEQQQAPIGFLAIGIVINLVLVAAYFIWAFKQWKKPEAPDKS